MPQICYFYGISIYIQFLDHNPPHIHAIYQASKAQYAIDTGELMAGKMPNKAQNASSVSEKRNCLLSFEKYFIKIKNTAFAVSRWIRLGCIFNFDSSFQRLPAHLHLFTHRTRVHKLIQEWIEIRRAELKKVWALAKDGKQVFPIQPLE